MILTPDQRLRIFVSSTLHELAEERVAAHDAIESLKLIPVMFEAGARPHPPQALYRSYLEQSDVFLGIYWQSYGWVAPDMEISGLEDEFRASGSMPRLLYIKNGGEMEPRLEEMLRRIQEEASVSYKRFDTATELAGLLKDDLILLLTERFQEQEHHAGQAQRNTLKSALPSPATPIVGRDREIAELKALLQDGEVRLVTLIGPGGIGKSRLAIEVASKFAHLELGSHFISLASLTDAVQVVEAVARAMDVSSGGSQGVDDLASFFKDRESLLVLDNFEQVLDASSAVGELLTRCAGLRILVTSRAPLRVRGEKEYDVPALRVPPNDATDPVAAYDAVKLFVERARAVRPDFTIENSDADIVAEICKRLDGLPLAIELAAARIRLLTPEALLKRLRERLDVLSGGTRDMPERHQTLKCTIEWSYNLLDDDSKRVFIALGAFRGGFTLDDAEQICRDVAPSFLESLSTLIEQSLVRSTQNECCDPRFSMLETVREYSAELLDQQPDREEILHRHATYYVELARDVGIKVRTADEPVALERLEAELDNMRAASKWLPSHGGAELMAEALFASWWFWWTRGYVEPAKRAAERVLAHKEDLSQLGYARALATKAVMAFWQNDFAFAMPAFFEAGQIFDVELDERGMALCDLGRGLAEAFMGDKEAGRARQRRGFHLFEQAGDVAGMSMALSGLLWEQCINRDFEDPLEAYQRSLELAESIGSHIDIGLAQSNLGVYLMLHGDEAKSLEYLKDALGELRAARVFGPASGVLDFVAWMAAGRDRFVDAVKLTGAARAVRERIQAPEPPPPAAAQIEKLLADARGSLGSETVDQALTDGKQLDFEAAIEAGLAELTLVNA